ncbi:MAG: trypsin-like peptidase domain-containing protein [Candidatus Dependentiae bacterium]|nr:trypsin-like peptidase domain-containing protein [Candidatus Dependentiae bacterium]
MIPTSKHRALLVFLLTLSSMRLCAQDYVDEALYEDENEIVVPTKSLWRPIQKKIRDTVVQIFSQIAELDWLQPYRTPSQYTARGSGFFINANGEIITNAHVVEQAIAVWIQIPSLGKRLIDVQIISICPERDMALLKVSDEDLVYIREELGTVPYLSLGDSDLVLRSDEVLALGYPLGQESIKSTSGVVSGREQNYIQTSAPINPGNSGGPLLNTQGEVVGINSAGITEAQNIGYAIPINDLKIILPDLHKVHLLRKPFLGILSVNATDNLTAYLGNPTPGGCYVVEIVEGSPLAKAGVQPGDMIYEINGNELDIYGEMTTQWSEDKVSIIDYVSRLAIGEDVTLVIYRKGERKECVVKFEHSQVLPIRKIYPGYENIDYEVFGGMVVMELSLNHVKMLINHAPGLAKYTEMKHQSEPVLLMTHIFPNSQLYRTRTLAPGVTIKEINDLPVKSLADFRAALKLGFDTNYMTIKAVDNLTRASDNLLVVLSFDKILHEEKALAQNFRYQISDTVEELFNIAAQKA